MKKYYGKRLSKQEIEELTEMQERLNGGSEWNIPYYHLYDMAQGDQGLASMYNYFKEFAKHNNIEATVGAFEERLKQIENEKEERIKKVEGKIDSVFNAIDSVFTRKKGKKEKQEMKDNEDIDPELYTYDYK